MREKRRKDIHSIYYNRRYEFLDEANNNCDDFSFALMGSVSNPDWGALPFGIVWTTTPSGLHAVNCFIDKNREVWIIEPQNDNIFKCPPDWDPLFIVI